MATPVEPNPSYGGAPTAFIGPPGVEPLPALVMGNDILTVWALSFDERQAILDGANLIVRFLGRMPPVSIGVEGVE